MALSLHCLDWSRRQRKEDRSTNLRVPCRWDLAWMQGHFLRVVTQVGKCQPALKQFFYFMWSNFPSNQVAIERFQGKLGEELSVTWHLSYINPRVFQIEDLILATTLEKVRLIHFRKEKAETCPGGCQLLFPHCFWRAWGTGASSGPPHSFKPPHAISSVRGELPAKPGPRRRPVSGSTGFQSMGSSSTEAPKLLKLRAPCQGQQGGRALQLSYQAKFWLYRQPWRKEGSICTCTVDPTLVFYSNNFWLIHSFILLFTQSVFSDYLPSNHISVCLIVFYVVGSGKTYQKVW